MTDLHDAENSEITPRIQIATSKIETKRSPETQNYHQITSIFFITLHGGLKAAAVSSALVTHPELKLILSCDGVDYLMDLLSLPLIFFY